jgi:uncharacterized protein (DUF2336 family)
MWGLQLEPFPMSLAINVLQDALATVEDAPTERRGALLRHVTDLFIVGADRYSEEDLALFDDVFEQLVGEIERSARALLALRLAPLLNAPPKIMRRLAFDDAIEIAGPILSQSPSISDSTLLESAKLKGQDHLLAISRRPLLSALLTDILVERGDQQVVFSTVNNRGAIFSDIGFDRLIARAQSDDRLAISIASRADMPPRLFDELLRRASTHVRAKLIVEYPHTRQQVNQAVADVADHIQSQAPNLPDPNVATRIMRLHKCGLLTDYKLRTFAENGQVDELVATIALRSQLSDQAVEALLAPGQVEKLLVVAKAIGLSWSATRAILELQAKKYALPQDKITQLLASYERLPVDSAQRMATFYGAQFAPTVSTQPRGHLG